MSTENIFNPIGTMSSEQIKARHQEKVMAILIWLARYNFSTAFLFAILLKINISNVRALLKQMLQSDLVKTELLPSGHRVYGISITGIGLVDHVYPKLADLAKPFQSGRTPVSTFAHQFNVQLAELSLTVFGWDDIASSRELSIFRDQQTPDLSGIDPNGMRVAIEVELHLKSSQRMKVICSNYAGMVAPELDPCTCYQRVLYLTPYPKRLCGMLDKYVPAEKRGLFEVDRLYLPPLLLTPRRSRGGYKK